ncbi:MAG: hypothetical protein ACKO32_15775 [Planctomycetia bacterium]
MSASDKDKQPSPGTAPKAPTVQRREERAADKQPEKLDFAKLDLTIEKVEERIAPSETNVFDK